MAGYRAVFAMLLLFLFNHKEATEVDEQINDQKHSHCCKKTNIFSLFLPKVSTAEYTLKFSKFSLLQ